MKAAERVRRLSPIVSATLRKCNDIITVLLFTARIVPNTSKKAPAKNKMYAVIVILSLQENRQLLWSHQYSSKGIPEQVLKENLY
jgi:hypothetical protein